MCHRIALDSVQSAKSCFFSSNLLQSGFQLRGEGGMCTYKELFFQTILSWLLEVMVTDLVSMSCISAQTDLFISLPCQHTHSYIAQQDHPKQPEANSVAIIC